MDPLRPVDPDEEFSRDAATEPDANDSDVEAQADVQSASAGESPLAADQSEVVDNTIRIESHSIPLPPANESSPTIAAPTRSESGPMASPDYRESEPTRTLVDSTPAPAEVDVERAAELMPAIEPVDAASPTGISQLADSTSDVSADQIVSSDSRLAAVADPSSDAATTAEFTSDVAEDAQPAASAPLDPIAEYVRSAAELSASREGYPNSALRQDAPAAGAKCECPNSQAMPASDEQRVASLRAEFEALLENFKDEDARTRALLSPAAAGGPPMARPIVLVSLAEEQMQAVTSEALAQSGSRTAKRAAELAQEKVDEAFWLRDCEMRALLRGR